MEDLEFYILDNELWCLFSDGRNEQVTEHNTELVREILSKIREFYPEAYKDSGAHSQDPYCLTASSR